jgi:predicted nucleic acid-binding protein
MRVLVDTNVVVRGAQPNHPLWAQSTRAVSRLIRQGDAPFYCSQNIAEFWNVATRPADLNGLGLSHEEALREVSGIEMLLSLLPDVPVKVYDARLVAIMSVYSVENILTFNVADFKRYSNVAALHPSTVLT